MKIHQILINDENKIPQNLPIFTLACQESLHKCFPNFEYKLYSGGELEKIIKNNFDKDVYTAYKILKPYACKADLARACLVYLYGGLYSDLNILWINPIPKITEIDIDFLAFKDLSYASTYTWAVQNGIMFSSKPKCLILKRQIELIVENCKNKNLGKQAIDICGTAVLGRAIMDCNKKLENVIMIGELKYFNPNNDFLNYLNTIDNKIKFGDTSMGFFLDPLPRFPHPFLIAMRKPSAEGDIASMGFEGTNNYCDMWKAKDIYDENVKF